MDNFNGKNVTFRKLNENNIVYFIRHAKPDLSIKDDMTRPLSFEGMEKSNELVKIFKKVKIDYFYSSPYKRSIQTIEPLARNKKINIENIDDFRERKICNDWIDDIDEFYKKQWDDFSYKLIDGESLNEVQRRNIKELDRILMENNGKTIIIGTHGTALSTIMNYYDKTFKLNDFLKIVNIMPCIFKINFNNGNYIKREEIKI